MVHVVSSVALSIVIAAATFERTQATSLDCNAYMPTGTEVPLNDDHPAVMKDYNGAVPVEIPLNHCKAATTESDPMTTDVTGDPSRRLRRMEDATNSDVQDLETYFGERLEVDFSTLKAQYASAATPTIPWPGSYWPTYQDGINVIWKAGEQSASEKYAKAYGLNPTELQDKLSAVNGIDAHANKTKCTTDIDCSARPSKSVCATRKEANSGYCIPMWYGICHAWAPAAMLENEPKCNVEKNGQTFHVMDIKALVTAVYDGSAISTVFTGARSNGPDIPASTDMYGRFTSATRRDLGAGFFHLAITTIMGKHKQSFIMDVTAGAQVWNQPVRAYEVQTMELVDATQASQQFFGTQVYPFNDQMVYLAYVKTSVSWIVEAYADGPLVSTQQVDTYTHSRVYEYLLELDATYAVIGGEWVERSKTDHPDFLWFPTTKPDTSTVTSAGLSYANVIELLDLSVSCGGALNASQSADASMSASSSSLEATTTTTEGRAAHALRTSTGTEPSSTIDDDGSFLRDVSRETSLLATVAAPIMDTDYRHSLLESTGSVPFIDSGYYTPPTTSNPDVPPPLTLPEHTTVQYKRIQTAVHHSCH